MMFRVRLIPDNQPPRGAPKAEFKEAKKQRVRLRRAIHVLRDPEGRSYAESRNKGRRGSANRVALLAKHIRDSWEHEGSYTPEVDNMPPPMGHNNPPEALQSPDHILEEAEKEAGNKIVLDIPAPALFLMYPGKRYKVIHGGRGSAKSWSVARCLIAKAHESKLLILCVREYQNSISDSVHRLLSNQIAEMGLTKYFDIQKNTIISKRTGAEFIFKGMHRNIEEIKSTEGVDICWLEEAQSATKSSLDILIPTIRGTKGKKTELWITYNPRFDDDPIYKRFGPDCTHPNAAVVQMNWRDNPWFPEDLDEERKWMLNADPDAYDHIWEGHTQRISEATILRNKFVVESFTTPKHVDRFFYGVDWGFANDPIVMTRSFIKDNKLYVDYEAYGIGVNIDEIKDRIFDQVPESYKWPIKADNSRPETISYMSRQGFNIAAAEKWPGSVEDGIAHLRGFDMIVIHERCVHTAQEARLYSYKVDKKTGDILPIVEDKNNHAIDSLRYGLDGYIQARGGLGIWLKLAKAA